MKRFVKRCKAAALRPQRRLQGALPVYAVGGGWGPSRAETRNSTPAGGRVSALLGPYAGSARLSRPPQPGMSRHTRARVDTAEPEPAGSGGPGRGCLLAAFALASTLAALRSCEDARKYVQKMDLHLGLLWSRLRATMSCRLYLSLSVPFSLISPHPHPCYLPATLPVSAESRKVAEPRLATRQLG